MMAPSSALLMGSLVHFFLPNQAPAAGCNFDPGTWAFFTCRDFMTSPESPRVHRIPFRTFAMSHSCQCQMSLTHTNDIVMSVMIMCTRVPVPVACDNGVCTCCQPPPVAHPLGPMLPAAQLPDRRAAGHC